MSTIISFSDRDLKRGTVVEPAWYRMKVESVGEQAAEDKGKGPSTNYPVEATILFNGETGDTKYADVPVVWNLNSKFTTGLKEFLEAFGVELKAGTRYDLKSAEGQILDVYIENGTWNNRLKNEVNHKYRQPIAEVTAVAPATPVSQ